MEPVSCFNILDSLCIEADVSRKILCALFSNAPVMNLSFSMSSNEFEVGVGMTCEVKHPSNNEFLPLDPAPIKMTNDCEKSCSKTYPTISHRCQKRSISNLSFTSCAMLLISSKQRFCVFLSLHMVLNNATTSSPLVVVTLNGRGSKSKSRY